MKQLDVRGVRSWLALALGCATLATACGGKGIRTQPDGGGVAPGDGSGSSADTRGDGAVASDATSSPPDGPGATDARPGDAPADQSGGNTGGGGGGGAGGTGGSPPDGGPPDRPPDVGGCPVDCSHLPHVLAGANVACVNGECNIPFGVCETNYAHCRGSGNGGCESSLTTASDCGSCNFSCFGSGVECRGISGVYRCATACVSPTLDACAFQCVDFKTDVNNCGACGKVCYQPNALSSCTAGQCVMSGCMDGLADCGGVNDGCETALGSDTDCGACGDKPCQVVNTLFTCHDGAAVCDAGLCSPGFANCDLASPDCETPFTMTASCLPSYIDTLAIASGVQDFGATAVAADGSVFLAGMWSGAVDFDPSSAGKDIRTTNDQDSFVTKFNADGSYAWTASFGGRGSSALSSLALAPSGAVVVGGTYNDTIILDPSGAVAPLQTATPDQVDPFIAELTAAGKLAWGGSFRGQASDGFGSNVHVATDASGAVFVAGMFGGSLDFDPGPGDASHSVVSNSGMLVKLSPTGAFQSARFYDNNDYNCQASLAALTVASDGNVWAVGSTTTGTRCALDPRVNPAGGSSVLIVKHDAANTPLGKWLIGPSLSAQGNAIAAAAGGAVIVGGITGPVDFDPGAGVVHHWAGASAGGFILKLDASAGFRWVRTLTDGWIDTMAATPDGGVIAIGGQGDNLVTRVGGDGGAVWTFKVGGGSTTPRSVASGAGRFAIAGNSSGNVDMNPGPALDLVFGDITFVSRYSF